MKETYIAVQYKSKKIIQIYKLEDCKEPYFTIEHAISRNGKSFCTYDKYIAVRNLKKKCFEIIDIEFKQVVMNYAYEDIWYYNNYHVLGHVFVFPHYMKVTFFDSQNDFKQLQSKGVDFDWYKNDDSSKVGGNLLSQTAKGLSFQKKFVILKDSNTICFDSGEGRIQVYNWIIQQGETELKPSAIVFERSCSLRDHQIAEVIDSNIVSVVDFQFNGKTKLYNVSSNKIVNLPINSHTLNSLTGSTRTRTFASAENAFSLSNTEQSLFFHFNEFRDCLEIINHDCMDFVFYQDKDSKEIKVLSFMEQNEQFVL